MKKYTKLVVFILALLIVFGTYKIFTKGPKKLYYIPLGDSIAEGMDPYLRIDYGYTDYIKDYLEKNNRLSFYTKGFTKSGYRTKDVKYDIETNKTIEVEGETIYLKEALRNSDLVTLTIGANDFIGSLNLNNIESKISNVPKTKKEADEIAIKVKELIILIKKYAKNRIIVTGYFNPFPRLTEYKEEVDEIVKYFDHLLEEVCEELDVEYVDIFDLFEGNRDALPNPFNIHPSKIGYELIANEIIKILE